MDDLVFIIKKYLEKIFLLLIILLVSTGFVLFLNLENIRIVSQREVVIDAESENQLENLEDNSKIKITGTPNSLFKSVQRLPDRTLYIFSLKEYIFDFILVTNEEHSVLNEFTCIDITSADRNIRENFIQEFNTPIEFDENSVEGLDILNEESRTAIMENTTGNFGSGTRLLNCTSNVERSEIELFFIIFVETVFLFLAIVFLLRKTFLDFMEDLYEELT